MEKKPSVFCRKRKRGERIGGVKLIGIGVQVVFWKIMDAGGRSEPRFVVEMTTSLRFPRAWTLKVGK